MIAAAVKAGEFERISRGVYRHADAEWDENLNLSEVLARVPKAIVVQKSALNFHQISTHQAHAVCIQLRQNAVTPRIDYPPLEVFRASNPLAFTEGLKFTSSMASRCPSRLRLALWRIASNTEAGWSCV